MLELWFAANTVFWPLKVKLGGISLNFDIVVLVFVGIVWLSRNWKIAASSGKAVLLFFGFLIFSFAVAVTGPCTDHFVKSILTAPILMLLVLIGLEVGRNSDRSCWLDLTKTAWRLLLVAFSSFLTEMLIPAWFPDQSNYRVEGKFSGLFQEPSHVAFSLFPCVAVLLISEDKGTRRKGMLAVAGLLLLSRSSTLIALIVAWVIYRLVVQRRFRQTVRFASGIALLAGLGASIDYSRFIMPTVDKVAGIAIQSQAESLSPLVYVQGWEDTWSNLLRTRGLGLGLNMMGCNPLPDVFARRVLAMEGFELNSEDGSFLFAKIVSETGVLGIIFYVVAVWWWVRFENRLRDLGDDRIYPEVAVQAVLIFCFLASSFIRGSGYFGGGLLLWVVSVGGASKMAMKAQRA